MKRCTWIWRTPSVWRRIPELCDSLVQRWCCKTLKAPLDALESYEITDFSILLLLHTHRFINSTYVICNWEVRNKSQRNLTSQCSTIYLLLVLSGSYNSLLVFLLAKSLYHAFVRKDACFVKRFDISGRRRYYIYLREMFWGFYVQPPPPNVVKRMVSKLHHLPMIINT